MPEIQSDKLIIATLEKALEIQDEMWKVELKKNKYKQLLDFHRHRLWSGTIVSPHYDEGEKK